MVKKHTVRMKPRNYRPESGETREMLRVLNQQRESVLEDLLNTELLWRVEELEGMLLACDTNILEAKRILKEELRKGV